MWLWVCVCVYMASNVKIRLISSSLPHHRAPDRQARRADNLRSFDLVRRPVPLHSKNYVVVHHASVGCVDGGVDGGVDGCPASEVRLLLWALQMER